MKYLLFVSLFLFLLNAEGQELKLFSSENNPKSEGILFSIRYPDTWEIEDSDRPHILKRISYKPNDSSQLFLLIMVEKLREEISSTEEINLRKYITSDEYLKSLPLKKYFKNSSAHSLVLDNNRAAFIDFNSSLLVLDEFQFARDNIYTIIYNGKYLIHLNFKIRSISEQSVNTLFANYNSLFKKMILTFVLQSKYLGR